jgi:hypothetical protein
MYATGNSKDGVYHFDSLPIAAASVDFFSDTKTQPSQAMREAMAFAPVGDEQKMEDPTTAELEMRVAKMLRKEAAVFLPSGARVCACVYFMLLLLPKRYTSILSYCVAVVVALSLCHWLCGDDDSLSAFVSVTQARCATKSHCASTAARAMRSSATMAATSLSRRPAVPQPWRAL